MSNEHKLTAPRVRVLVEREPGSTDYLEYVVQTDNRDMVRWDLLRARKQWPSTKEAPMLLMSVLAWHALKRAGETSDDVEAYLDKIVDVSPVDEDGQELDPATAEEGDGAASPLV